MVSTPPSPTRIDPPLGLHPAKVDEKGRLKLPVQFASYLTALQATKVFVTCLDLTLKLPTLKVYTLPVWMANKDLMTNRAGAVGEQVLLCANLYGDLSEMDSAGRLLLPTTLRRRLGIENAQVWMEAHDGVFLVYSQQVLEEKCREAEEDLAAKIAYLRELGLK
ncbi:MAG: Transcriptional regulator MraZ [Bryobacteraceae bacterium]|nr:Transcriptional regulator MraZ [Bryobacteraceae bacterium]MCC6343094.1 hypothetical protein [Bryobacterales bacterium]